MFNFNKRSLYSLFICFLITTHVAQASELSENFSQSVGQFKFWKTTIENLITSLKSSEKIPSSEIEALKFMYIPVYVNVNALIDRMISDLKLSEGNVDVERYRESLTKAQRSVNDFINYVELILQQINPNIKKSGEDSQARPMGFFALIPPIVTGVVTVVSFIAGAIAITDKIEEIYEKAEKEEKEKIIRTLEKLKFRKFEDI